MPHRNRDDPLHSLQQTHQLPHNSDLTAMTDMPKSDGIAVHRRAGERVFGLRQTWVAPPRGIEVVAGEPIVAAPAIFAGASPVSLRQSLGDLLMI